MEPACSALFAVALLSLSLGTACGSTCTKGGSCGGSGSVVQVNVQGSPEAFESRRVLIAGVETPAAKPSGPGMVSTFEILCTMDRDRFLNAPITVTVTDMAGAAISETQVERFACRLSESPGYQEIVWIWLQDDGTILADFTAGSSNVYTSCAPPAGGYTCGPETPQL